MRATTPLYPWSPREAGVDAGLHEGEGERAGASPGAAGEGHELRELASAAKESPVHAAPRKLAQIRAVHSKLVRHSVDIAQKIDLSRDGQSIVSVLSEVLNDLLEAMEASAGRTLLHTRTL